jgi:peptidoglycan/LPS O-acetylase OafA/YrhL
VKRARIPELDGIRGLAALAVVLAHYFGEPAHGISALTVGWIGVSVFFVLSGFLIGGIIDENRSAPNFLKVFYIRRGARILPIYFAVCLLTLWAALLTRGAAWSDTPFPAWVYGVFTQNIALPVWGGGGKWLLPTWTLAVEEQFYLVLPMIFLLARRRWLGPILVALWLSAPLVRIAGLGNAYAPLTLLPSRMDLLLSGVLAAMLDARFDLSRHLLALRLIPLVCVLLLLGLAAASRVGGFEQAVTVLNPSLLGVGVSAFLLSLVHGAPEARRYASPGLQYFGAISYALYLVHQPVSGLLHGLILGTQPDIGTPAEIGVSLLAATCSIGLATASWRWLERPCLAWGRGFRFGEGRASAPISSPKTYS